jgi:hypothetical protein
MLYYPGAHRRNHVEIWQKKITRKCWSQAPAGRWSITTITNLLKTLTPTDVDTQPESVRPPILLNVAAALATSRRPGCGAVGLSRKLSQGQP